MRPLERGDERTEPESLESAHDHFRKGHIDHVEPYGTATVDSSEACVLAGLAHKWNWQQAREKAGKNATRPNSAP